MKIISWFSCGAASAVATKFLLNRYQNKHEIRIMRIDIPEEHPDNDRFAADCEDWFGQRIEVVKSDVFENCQAVWEARRYMAGIRGAPCTTIMKSDVRRHVQAEWQPDLQAFGFTFEESKRADRFRANNPEVGLITPLITEKITKKNCYEILEDAGVELPVIYKLGFKNNNCIGCVKSGSPAYWNRVRKYFPDVFAARAKLSRQIGAKLVVLKGVRMFLDELPPNAGLKDEEIDVDCSILCVTEEMVRQEESETA